MSNRKRMNQLVDPSMAVTAPYNPQVMVQPLYDREQINAASGALSAQKVFFSNPIGTSVTLLRGSTSGTVQKTRRDTNLTQNGFTANQAWGIHGIAIALYHNDPDNAAVANDRHHIMQNGWLDFIVDGSKSLIQMPLTQIPIINEIVAVATTATTTTINSYTGIKGNMFKFQVPYFLRKAQAFQVVLNFDDVTTTYTVATDAQIFLLGGVAKDS